MSTIALKGAHLSFQQERVWSFQQGNQTYRSQCTVVINGELNFRVFAQALQQIVEQHTIFQTVFYALPGMDIPVQVLGHQVELSCPIIDLEGIASAERDILLESLLMSFQEEAFDLKHGPLLRPILFRLSAQTALLFMSLSALYADAATLPLLITDLVNKYSANSPEQDADEEPLQYTDVSAWQKQQSAIESEESKLADEFWGKIDWTQLAQMQSRLEKIGIVESKHPHGSYQTSFEPVSIPLIVDDLLSTRLIALASSYKVTVESVLLTCWLVVLRRLTDEPQGVIGVACDGRSLDELATLPGLYTRFVPFSTYIEDRWSFERELGFIESALQLARQYQDYFSWPDTLNDNQDLATHNMFPVVFEQEYWPDSFTSRDLKLQFERCFCCTEPFVLKLSSLQVGKRLHLELQYDARYVSSESVKYLAEIVQTLLSDVVRQPQEQMGALSLLNNSERRHLLTSFSAPQRTWSAQGLHQLFEAQAQRHPDQLAVIGLQEQLTYGQLNEQANQLAYVLRQWGVGPNVLVGLCLSRQARMLVGMLGILKAGGAYLPLDVSSPLTRLHYQLQDSQAALLLTQEELLEQLPAWGYRTLCFEELDAELASAPMENLQIESHGEDLAYVIYTSGSTGQPKGVLIRQRSVVNYTRALCETFGSVPGWHYATVSTLAADLGNTAIFCALASGGCVQVLPYEIVTSGEAMARWAAQHPIDVLKIVPSHLSALLESTRAHEFLPRRALVLGGEALPGVLVERVRRQGATCQIYNHYGPTETTIGVLVNAVSSQVREDALVALGRPITNTQVYVLDRRLQLVPRGVIGELYIGGSGVAQGYQGQVEQTAERFVPHPYSEVGGERLYRTGDLVRYGQGEQIEFVGRQDGQVKLRGYRIELGEIEVALRQHAEVRDGVVVLREDVSGEPQLVGYVVLRHLPIPTDLNLRSFMQERLPDYMVPSAFVYLKFLPLTANGKIDRRQLLAGKGEDVNAATSLIDASSPLRTIIQPRDALEMQLLQIWEDTLPLRPISVLDNFFDIGGHSLLAVRLMSHIAERLERNLDLTVLFQHPTIAALAVVLRQQAIPKNEPLLAAIQTQGSRIPFFCVHPAGGTAFRYVNLARCLGPDQPFYGLHSPFGIDVEGTELIVGETLEEIAAHYIEAIQTVQPQGPYLLGGWSLGGVIAFEMAQQLQRQGHEIGVLAIFDSVIADPQSRQKAIEEVIDLSDAGVVKDFISAAGIKVPDDFYQWEIGEQLKYVVAQAKEEHIIPEDSSIDLVRVFTRIRIMTKHVVHVYDAEYYTGKIDYFLSGSLSGDFNEYGEYLDRTEDVTEHGAEPKRLQQWRELAKGDMAVHHVTGRHVEIMDEPHVQVVAHELEKCIDEVYAQRA
ncbi:non-ribosomal peptide synthetase [Ktedonobacteria bacterium brp13]|nr:non-ribosomal peptide synthetase [Ktedonobacteria bacterium brp13]